MLEDCQVLVERLPRLQSSFQKLNFDNGKQKAPKIRYYVFVVLSNFAVFIYLARNILSEILVLSCYVIVTKEILELLSKQPSYLIKVFQKSHTII